MSNAIFESKEFGQIMSQHIVQTLHYLFDNNQHFGILCNIENVSFEPAIPDNIRENFKPVTLFFLAGYTFESAQVEKDVLTFEAGFGPDNIGSKVSVPLLSIMQVIVNETPMLINLAPYTAPKHKPKSDDGGLKNSMNAFLSNPKNKELLKNRKK